MRITLNKIPSIRDELHFSVIDKSLQLEVGMVELLIVDGTYWLNGITVSQDLQSNGYGKEILKFINHNYKPFRISLSHKTEHQHNSTESYRDARYLTLEGIYLSKSCYEKAILLRGNFQYPFPKKSNLLHGELDFLNNYFSNIQHNTNRFIIPLNRIKK